MGIIIIVSYFCGNHQILLIFYFVNLYKILKYLAQINLLIKIVSFYTQIATAKIYYQDKKNNGFILLRLF